MDLQTNQPSPQTTNMSSAINNSETLAKTPPANSEILLCKSCKFAIAQNFYFCPNCGKKIKEPPLSTAISKQIYLYVISFILPPLGLWPGIKYLLYKDPKAKIIGIICIALTVISIILTIQMTLNFINTEMRLLNQIGNPNGTMLNSLQNLGY